MNKSLTETISQSLCAYLVSMLTSSIATRSTLPLLLSFVQTVSPNPILCISGWNLIWITDCPHSILQLSLSDLCVHKRSFVFTECALVSMVMPLRYAYAKNNRNSNLFRLVKQRQTCRKLEYAALFRAAVSAIFLSFFFFSFFFFFLSLLLSKHKEVRVLAVYCFFPLDLHFAMTQACFCKDVQHVFCKNIWRVYVLHGVRTWKSNAKSDLTIQTETDFQKCDLNRIPNHIRM